VIGSTLLVWTVGLTLAPGAWTQDRPDVLKLRPTGVPAGSYLLKLSVRDPESGATGRSELALRID